MTMHRPNKEERMVRFAQAARDRNLFYNGKRLPYNRALTTFARELREQQTECETRVGEYLKSLSIKVRAQHPIDNYIVDFYIPAAHLVIEIDGDQHSTSEGKEYDSYRDEVLRMYFLEVMRISNEAVRSMFDEVCRQIRKAIDTGLADE